MIWFLVYNLFILPILFFIAIIMSLFNNKIRSGLLGRFNTYLILKDFMLLHKKNKDIYWLHAASLGEYEQIKPVLSGLKEIEPNLISIVSFFSPSGYKYVDDSNIDCKVYLPFDFPWLVKRCLKIVKPKKVILAAYDVWPNFIWYAKKMNIHSTLFAAHFSKGTYKLLPLIRNFYANVYGHISAIYTISETDSTLLKKILNKPIKLVLRVLGNPRYDEVKFKADSFTKERTESVLLRSKTLLVGSAHFEDQNIILESIVSLMNEIKELSLIWVYHAPNESNLMSINTFFESKKISVELLGDKEANEIASRVCLVDKIGVLSQLYWHAQMAYVGGGFSSGVHNVMEPAIARLPIFFGPRYSNSHEAEELIKDGGGFSINSGKDLCLGIKKLFNDKSFFIDSSYASTDVIHRNLGSSTRVVRNIIHD